MAVALQSLPENAFGLRRIAVTGEWLGLYGARLSGSQVLADIPDPMVLRDPIRFSRAIDALRHEGVVALLARRADVSLRDQHQWTDVGSTPWTLLNLGTASDRLDTSR